MQGRIYYLEGGSVESREKANFSGLSIWPILTTFMARRVSETPY